MTRQRVLAPWLAATVMAGAALRLWGIDFGLPALLDPDELIFELGAFKMVDSGTGNPGWFGHPATTTMYVRVMVNALVYGWGRMMWQFSSPTEFAGAVFFDPGLLILPGRIAMVLFALATIVLVFHLGRRVSGARAGVFAAVMIACSPLHIAWSQVVRSDILATTFLVASMLVAHRFSRSGSGRDLVFACVCAALAIVSKWPFAVAVLAIYGAVVVGFVEGKTTTSDAIKTGVLSTVVTIAFAILISPYLILDYGTVASNLAGEVQEKHIGKTGGTLLANFWFYLSEPLWMSFGPLGLLLAGQGIVQLRRNAGVVAIIFVPSAVMFLIICSQNLVWERWGIALLPALAVAAGSSLSYWFGLVGRLRASVASVAMVAISTALLAPLLVTSYFAARERSNDNRKLATEWTKANVPPGSRVMVEHFAFDLADTDLDIIFPVAIAGCLDSRALLRGKVEYSEIDANRGGNSNLDYAAVPVSQQGTCAADFAILTEFARYRAERQAFAKESAKYDALIECGKVVARFPAVPGEVGGKPEVIVVDLRK